MQGHHIRRLDQLVKRHPARVARRLVFRIELQDVVVDDLALPSVKPLGDP